MTVENISFFKYFFIFLEFFSNASLSPKKRFIARSSRDSFPSAKYFSFCEKETFSGIFLILETRRKNKITPKRTKKKTTDKPTTFVSIKYSCQTILTFPGLLLIQTAK